MHGIVKGARAVNLLEPFEYVSFGIESQWKNANTIIEKLGLCYSHLVEAKVSQEEFGWVRRTLLALTLPTIIRNLFYFMSLIIIFLSLLLFSLFMVVPIDKKGKFYGMLCQKSYLMILFLV